MKTLAYQPYPHSSYGYLQCVLVVVALVALASVYFLHIESARLRQQVAAKSERLKQLINRADILAQNEGALPSIEQINDLQRAIRSFNSLAGDYQTAHSQILEALESALPNDVWVNSLVVNYDVGSIKQSLVSKNQDQLADALEKLQHVPFFRSVELNRQLKIRQGAEVYVQFDVEARIL